MRIDSSGDVFIGTTSDIAPANGTNFYISDGTVSRFGLEKTGSDARKFSIGNGGTYLNIYDETADSERLRIDSSGNVGINSTDPSTGRLVIPQSNSSQPAISLPTDESTIQGPHANTQIKMGGNLSLNGASIISLGTGGSEAMRISSAGSVGIGNSSPVEFLTIGDTSDSATKIQLLSSTSGVNTIHFGDGTSGSSLYRGYINYAHSTDSMTFGTSAGDKVTIDSSGHVGIGASSPDSPLTVQPAAQGVGTNATQNWMYSLTSGSEYDLKLNQVVSSGLVKYSFTLRNNGTSYADNLVLDRGNVGIGISSPGQKLAVDGNIQLGTSSGAGKLYLSSATGFSPRLEEESNALVIYTNNSERMRIDSSGNLLVGKTSSSFSTAGIEARSGGTLWATASDTNAASFNRLSSDGVIAYFNKDSSSVGIIAVNGSDNLQISASAADHAGLEFATHIVAPLEAGSASDGTISLGASSARFDDIFATNGTIQTSDQNEKQDIAGLTATEMKVGKRISALFKTFRWKSKVTEKGDAARTHTGIIAQDVQAAFSSEGLDASKYALWCSDTWTNDDGSEQTRMGVRYPELLSFLSAYNEQRFTDIEARITALEGA
jgi:hypothetical protein